MNQNLQKYGIDLNIFLVIQWGHNFAHVTTAVLSRHVQYGDYKTTVL